MKAGTCLGIKIIKRTIVGQMALGACCANAMIIVATVNIVIMRTLKQLHTVAAYAKFRVRGRRYPFIGDKPASKWQDHKSDKATHYDEYDNLSLS